MRELLGIDPLGSTMLFLEEIMDGGRGLISGLSIFQIVCQVTSILG